ncbi:hypothetical protein FBZ93_12070 [Bradyrhizobium macuxiense]|uniref:Uncharacterized protein n=1 Tax=Bradyrhizobium macuxiense TaxID=1755647 RepID=A0A560KX56_9BRAD|nr:hypothetical protein FBZ93_12070 [Bradyrhizobium macuxiense]
MVLFINCKNRHALLPEQGGQNRTDRAKTDYCYINFCL